MSADTLFDQPTTTRLHGLIKSIQAGKLLFPDFRRPFVWNSEQRLLLFDSVLKGLPIGSILVWRTTIKLVSMRRIGSHSLPQPNIEDGRGYHYILDGVQRLSTLYFALAGRESVGDEVEDIQWPLYYNLEMDLNDGDFTRFKAGPFDRRPPVHWMPLFMVFNSKDLWAYQIRLHEQGLDTLAERAEQLVNRFRDYNIAVVPILTDDINLATQSFQRINSTGTPISEVQMLRTLVYSSDLDLTRRFERFAESLSWDGGIALQTLINTLKAIRGLNIYRADLSELVDALRCDTDLLPRMEDSVRSAVAFCVSCGVRSEAALPYASQLVALARAAAQGAKLNTPELEWWLWATTFTEYFTGMTSGQLRAAFEHVEALCTGAPRHPPDMPDACTTLERFNSASVRALALMHLLARREIIDIEGNPIKGARLISRGRETFAKLLLDTPAYDPANRILVAPEEASATRKILFDSEDPLSDALRKAHLLPPWDDPASDSTESMLDWRRDRLRKLEVRFIEKKLGLKVRSET